jgi:hypothetical protein
MELEPEIIRPGENSYPSENPNDEPDLLPEYSTGITNLTVNCYNLQYPL